jgi:hypothetical protein|nr:MAG TPA: Putative antitoxin [Caudoviricetes sp.]
MKTVTIRMQEELASWLSEQGDSMNQTIIDLLNNARYARLYALNELRGKFGEKEWAFLAEALNGNYASDQFRYNKKGLIGHCEDSEDMYGLATKHKIDLPLLTQKIDKLSASQVEALYYRVEKFWEIAEMPQEVFNTQEKLEDWNFY